MDGPTWSNWKDLVISFDFAPDIGGAHSWLYEVYRRWPTKVEVLTSVYSDIMAMESRQREFDLSEHGSLHISRKVIRYGSLSILNPRFCQAVWQCWRAGRMFGNHSPIRLHALRAFPEGFIGYVLQGLWRSDARLITYAHGEEVLVARSSRQLATMARLTYESSTLIVANSENTRREVMGLARNANVVVIHPGVDPLSFGCSVEAAEECRKGFGWSEDTVVVLTLGRMEARKNHAGVMRAVSALRDQGLSVGYVCAGDGPERTRLERLASSLGIQKWVLFTGVIEEQYKALLFSSADLFAMPAIQVGEMIEGFGIVFLEAAAAGIPVVSGDSGGQPEAVRDGVTGIVVDGTKDTDIVRAIGSLVRDVSLRRKMGRAAREWAREHTWESVVQQTVGAVETAC